MNNAQAVQQALAANDVARAAIVSQAMPRQQIIGAQSVTGTVTTSNNTLVFNPVLTGLLTGFLVEINATYENLGAGAGALTNFGALNTIDRVQFVDLSNFTRHNTKGYHFGLLNSCKLGSWYGGAVAPNLPYDAGNIFNVNSLSATIDAAGGANDERAVRIFYYIPIAYSVTDLRGAIFAQVVNATMQLQIQLNAAPGTAPSDELNAVYNGANTNVIMKNATVQVSQIYYDQLPRAANGQPVLPIADLSTMYMLNDTSLAPLVVNQDNTAPYANYRTYLSTFAIFDNGGTYNTGSDVDYWALQYANGLRQFQYKPETVALYTRNQIGFDTPPGTYYFDHRAYPISTANYGNCELVLRPTTVNAAAAMIMLYEQFAMQQTILSASSLPQAMA